MGRAGNVVTDISYPALSEQGRKVTRIAYTGCVSNAILAALGTTCVDKLAARPTEVFATINTLSVLSNGKVVRLH